MARMHSDNQEVTKQQEPESHDSVDRGLSRFEIEKLAYQLWKDRGQEHGSPDRDWLLAERQLTEATKISR